MQELDELHQKATAAAAAPKSSATATNSTQRNLQQHYAALYDTLLEHGFEVEHVQAALAALHSSSAEQQRQHWSQLHASTDAASGLEAALDWLCLNVPPAQLPRRFTGSSAAQVAVGAAGVKVGWAGGRAMWM